MTHTFTRLFTDDGLDQICETSADANRETRDLRAMGCEVSRYTTGNESDLYAIHDWIREGVTFARARVEAGHFVETETAPAKLAAVTVRASTPALETVARVIAARVASGAATGRDYTRLRVFAATLATRQHMGRAPAPRDATPAFIASASARRAELDSAFALKVRPAARPVFMVAVVALALSSPAMAATPGAELAAELERLVGLFALVPFAGPFALAGVAAFALWVTK